jgi:hypothetical protein
MGSMRAPRVWAEPGRDAKARQRELALKKAFFQKLNPNQ